MTEKTMRLLSSAVPSQTMKDMAPLYDFELDPYFVLFEVQLVCLYHRYGTNYRRNLRYKVRLLFFEWSRVVVIDWEIYCSVVKIKNLNFKTLRSYQSCLRVALSISCLHLRVPALKYANYPFAGVGNIWTPDLHA